MIRESRQGEEERDGNGERERDPLGVRPYLGMSTKEEEASLASYKRHPGSGAAARDGGTPMGKEEAVKLQADLKRYKAREAKRDEWRKLPFGACVKTDTRLQQGFGLWRQHAGTAQAWQDATVTVTGGDREWGGGVGGDTGVGVDLGEGGEENDTDGFMRAHRGCRAARGCRPTCVTQ